ncbi:MAG: hypothetical protein RLZZ618_1032 [Pseudomonadota bacterium]|jgi:uncharacterized protein (TIGR02270 family)
MSSFPRPAIPVIVHQHHESAASLFGTRAWLVSAPHARLHQLGRLDERLQAYLDGLAVAGPDGLRACEKGLSTPGPGEIQTAAVHALAHRHADLLQKLFSLVSALPENLSALASAFGWVAAPHLRGVTRPLLDASDSVQRSVGLLACAMHAVDPGPSLSVAVTDADASLRATAWRVAGQVGRTDLLPMALRSLADPDAAARFETARAAVLLGDRQQGAAALRELALAPGPHREAALSLWLKVASIPDAHALLKALTTDPSALRLLVRGTGLSGDAVYLPWLLKQMESPTLARLAGESFATITGLDLTALDLDGNAHPEGSNGPVDNPDDPDVSPDEDDNLPWPDPARLSGWWQANGARHSPGVRWFGGAEPSSPHVFSVLKSAPQRQRQQAAEYLSLLQPGVPVFNTAAPAWRQQRQLAAMQA